MSSELDGLDGLRVVEIGPDTPLVTTAMTDMRRRSGMLDHPFKELDELVLDLKGLVLIERLRRERGADADELNMFTAEISRARTRLASFVQSAELPQAA
jgi:hypothetical protein